MYKYQSLAQIVRKNPKMRQQVKQALGIGSSGKKSGMWTKRKTVVGVFVEKFPKRFKDLSPRQVWQKIKEETKEVVGV